MMRPWMSARPLAKAKLHLAEAESVSSWALVSCASWGRTGTCPTVGEVVPFGGFQTGQCNEKDRWNNCLKDGQSKHQCAKCLSEDHGANVCPQSGPKAPRVYKGKGTGGRGGKKGGKSKKN